MLNIFNKKKNNFGYSALDPLIKKEKNEIKFKNKKNIQGQLDRKEYKNTIFYPSAKEWFSIVYSYNKSYTKSLIVLDRLVNNLLTSYFNMLEYKIRIPFKRKRSNKIRYSADRIYLSRAEWKHTNAKLTILLYVYNKQKLSIGQFTKKVIKLVKKNIYKDTSKETYINRLSSILQERFFLFKKWKNVFFNIGNNLLNHLILSLNIRPFKSYTISLSNLVLTIKGYKLEQIFFNSSKRINFNKLKFNTLFLSFRNLGIYSMIEKIYNKAVIIKLVELKSINLNSDIFASAVALKIRDRKIKALNVLRKGIFMLKIPSLHMLRTSDDQNLSGKLSDKDNGSMIQFKENGSVMQYGENRKKTNYNCSTFYIEDHIVNKHEKNILNAIEQQVVSGVRFEASGRLTRRLTAMRAVFKYRYIGSLKNLRSSLNRKSSTLLRGHVKSNSQYTIIGSKTRNGSFGLKSWVSSH